MAFAGWADAGESATNTIKYIRRRLNARKFAEIDPEEFFDFTMTRPYTVRKKDGSRQVNWPSNEFSWAVLPDTGEGVMFYLGVEPNLRWRTFSKCIAGLARDRGVQTVVHLGALLDAVPHSREVRLTRRRFGRAYATLAGRLQYSRVQLPGTHRHQFNRAGGLRQAGAWLTGPSWGHTSHYLQAAPNYRVSYTLAETLSRMLDLPLNFDELRSAAEMFDREVAKAIAKDEQISAYVSKLESQYDETVPVVEMPDPADMVRDLEQFLRSEQRRRPEDPHA